MEALEWLALNARLDKIERYLNSATPCYLCDQFKRAGFKHQCQMFRSGDTTSIIQKIQCHHSSQLGQEKFLKDYYVLARLAKDNPEHTKISCQELNCLRKIHSNIANNHLTQEFLELYREKEEQAPKFLPFVNVNKDISIRTERAFPPPDINVFETLVNNHECSSNLNNDGVPLLQFFQGSASEFDSFDCIQNSSTSYDSSSVADDHVIQDQNLNLASFENRRNAIAREIEFEYDCTEDNSYKGAENDQPIDLKWTTWEFKKRSRFKCRYQLTDGPITNWHVNG